MNPWLVYGEHVRLPTYFTLLMVGFALATFVLRREAMREGLEPRRVLDAALAMFTGSLVGARLGHVLFEAPAYYVDHPLQVLSPLGGWVFYGGAIGGSIALVAWCRLKGLPPWAVLDIYTVATPFGLIFGRLGCLGGGCCYGRVADWPLGVEVPWAVTYYRRGHLPEELLGVPLHPTPLYAIGLAVSLFVAMSVLRTRQRFEGQVFLGFLACYAVGRGLIEVFRADAERGLYAGGLLSTSQVIGVATAVVALAVWTVRSRRCTPSS